MHNYVASSNLHETHPLGDVYRAFVGKKYCDLTVECNHRS